MFKKIFTFTAATVLSINLSFNALAFTTGHPYVSLISGDTGRTYTWTTPVGTQITMPVIKKDAVIRLKQGETYDTNFFDATGTLQRDVLYWREYNHSAFTSGSVSTEQKTDFTPVKFTQFDSSYMNPLDNPDNKPYRWQGGDFILAVMKYSGDYKMAGYITEGDSMKEMNANLTSYFYVSMSDDTTPSTGWKSDSRGWWYVKADGNYIQNDWLNLNGTWYYFNNSGYMVVGWNQIGGTWYYFNNSGSMATGWANLSGRWYYLGSSGAMTTGWASIGGKWYYFNNSGAMLSNTTTPDGYRLDSTGAMIE